MSPILCSRVSGHVARFATLGGFAILAACGGSSEPKIDVTPAIVTPASSDTLRGAVGTQLATPISVTVKNKAGNPIDSAVVTFAVTSGAGSVGAASVRTDATGQASTPSQLYLINPATRLATDSISLGAPPVRMVMTSTGTRAFVDENNFQLEIVDIASRAVVATSVVPGTVNAMKMGPGDTVLYAGTAFGNVYEISVATGAIRRSFTPSTSLTDLEISPDGKTLFVADGTTSVFMVRLATGGLNGVVDFGQNVSAVGQPPDARQLWVSQGSTVYAAPAEGNSFNASLVAGRVTVAGATLSRITFTRVGDVAVVVDAGGNQLVIIK
jgi:hypothetical protein